MPASAASLDSVAPSEDSWEEDDRLLEREWQESLEDLQRLLTFVLMPVFGKWLGRSTSHWVFARYTRLGLGKSFFLGERVFRSMRG